MSTGLPTDSPAPSPGDGTTPPTESRRFGNYILLKELGRGAQGVVHLAEDATLHRKVALKMLTGAGLQSQESRDRFRREAHLTSKFEHPGICGVHDMGEVDGIPYIAMQYVRGTTLASIVEKSKTGSAGKDEKARGSDTITLVGGGGKGGLEDVLRLIESAARALHVAHEAGLVHRDIKPANIMVTSEGQPVLLDFGLARDLEAEGQTLTQSGQIMGTPAYLAPEQIVASRGAVGRRTDVYALGVTLFECLTMQRPYEGATWDQLFHEILDGATRNPRKLNPRIPEDLRTIIEVAMDRDPLRRYASAEAFAEDLRRVRSFEPIQAKAAGPITRALKWSRRNPGKATGIAAGVLFVLVVLGFFVTRTIQRVQSLRGHLVAANEALMAADYVRASVEVAQALELDPDSPEVQKIAARVKQAQEDAQKEADHKQAMAGAEAARAEAQTLGVSYAETRRKIDELAKWIQDKKSDNFGRYKPVEDRGAFSGKEGELRKLEQDAKRTLFARSEALERARRLEAPYGGASVATLSALSSYYMERWREDVANRDLASAEAMRTAVEHNDPTGEHRAELLGRGALTLALVPSAAEAFLFRYEEYETVRPGNVIPRLVPVPTSGVGRVREGEWAADFHPGDPCLVVRAVERGSIAEKNGLVPGDLILRCQDRRTTGWVCVREIEPGSCLEHVGVAPLTRVSTVDGQPIHNRSDWEMRVSRRDSSQKDRVKKGPEPVVTLEGETAPISCGANEIPVVDELELIHDGASVPLRLECLVGGESRTIELAAGARAGVRVERTAYPLILAPANRIEAGGPREMDPGSYLIFARQNGFESQRYSVVVRRRDEKTEARVELLPVGGIPEGYAYVPAGPFQLGGDPAAFRARAAQTVDLPGFFIARHELTNREWFAFVNDSATLAKIAAKPAGSHLYLPEDIDRGLSLKVPEGQGYTWDAYCADTGDTPVLGLCWTDARDYLEWRNARAAEHGDAWRFRLPTEEEWEKAARGTDGRFCPWGNRFDPTLTVCLVRQQGYLLDAPGGSEPCDESPFGLLDMGGSREEWLSDAGEKTNDKVTYRKRGGSWLTAVEITFHCASRGSASENFFSPAHGLRLVAYMP